MITLVFGDIFEQEVDAIVNPANGFMLHGGGLAAEIIRRAGPSVTLESAAQAPIGVGEAIHTSAGKLPLRGIIHAVGPRWVESDVEYSPYYAEADAANQDAQLASAYRNAIREAAEHGYESIALPAISCGVFRFPVDEAAPIAVAAIADAMSEYPTVTDVRICVLDDAHYAAFDGALRESA